MRKVFVLGSVNMDLNISAERIPFIGESVRGFGFFQNQGGKGANQAIACAKLGCENVYFLGAVGRDDYGKALLASVESYGIDTAGVSIKDGVPSGVCVILFDSGKKDNMLIVDTGANDALEFEDFAEFLRKNSAEGDILVTQLEIPFETVRAALRAAKELGLYAILNPAPAAKLDKDILVNTDLLVPNETEFKFITDIDAADETHILRGYDALREMGLKRLIVTRGAEGSMYVGDSVEIVPAVPAEAVDTTAAGDTFIGALTYGILKGMSLPDAMRLGSKCSAITVSRKGAAQSIPTLKEIQKIYKESK